MVAKLCRRREWFVVWAGVGIVLCLSIAGCGSDRLPVVPVEGTVRYRGKPLESGSVTFLSAAGPVAVGEIQKDGRFHLTTYRDGDGATLGTHQVTVGCYREPTAAERAKAAGSEPLGPIPVIPRKYLAPSTSGLTAEVKSQNEPFRLELAD
jgi:hypothetical protein